MLSAKSKKTTASAKEACVSEMAARDEQGGHQGRPYDGREICYDWTLSRNMDIEMARKFIEADPFARLKSPRP